MADSTLYMESEDLRELAGKFITSSNGLGTLATTFKTNGDGMTDPSVWTGDEVEAFQTAVNDFKSQLDKVVALLNDIGTNFNSTAGDYDDTNSGVASRNANL